MAKQGSRIRSTKRSSKNYDPKDLARALQQVRKGNIVVFAAAKKYRVPYSTLYDRTTKPHVQTKPGPQPTLPEQAENALASWILERQLNNMCVTRKFATQKIAKLMTELGKTFKNKTVVPSRRWWTGFLTRHSEISLRTPTKKKVARCQAEQKAILKKYFAQLRVVKRVGYTPSQIWNYDETKILSEVYNASKVLAATGSKNAPVIATNQNKHITALALISAAGKCLPPTFICEQSIPADALRDLPKWNGNSPMIVRSEKGYITAEIFTQYFNRILAMLPKKRPLLLLVDGHSSHFTVEILDKAKAEHINIYCFPSHLTHILQPLDVSVFGPLKRSHTAELEKWTQENPKSKVTLNTVLKCACKAWQTVFTSKLIIKSFRESGVHPCHENTILSKIKDTTPAEDDKTAKLEKMLADVFQADEPEAEPEEEPATRPPKIPKHLSNLLVTDDEIIEGLHQQKEQKEAEEQLREAKRVEKQQKKKAKQIEKSLKQFEKDEKVYCSKIAYFSRNDKSKN